MSQQLIKAFNEVMSNKKSYVSQKEMGHIGVPDDGEGNEGLGLGEEVALVKC